MTDAPPVVALFGATALGKSEVAVVLAERLDADIVVADSMQVYAGLPILTNQPDAGQRRRGRHHLVGSVSPQHDFAVAEFARHAHAAIDELIAAGRRVIVEGGSGLYLRAALGDLVFGAPPDAGRRRALEALWDRDPAAVVAELERVAPGAAARLDARNPRRVIRAIEAATGAAAAANSAEAAVDDDAPAPIGSPMSPSVPAAQDRLWCPGERYAHRLFALVPDEDRSALTLRIEARVDEMLVAGALEEVAAARSAGPLSRTAAQAIGVRELSAVLDGELALPEAAARMKARTRALARRQLTWMRKLPAAAAVPAAGRPPAAIADEVYNLLQSGSW